MKRVQLARLVADNLSDNSVVITALGSTSRAWASIEDSRPTYSASDPMGIAPSIALGFALASPQRQVRAAPPGMWSGRR